MFYNFMMDTFRGRGIGYVSNSQKQVGSQVVSVVNNTASQNSVGAGYDDLSEHIFTDSNWNSEIEKTATIDELPCVGHDRAEELEYDVLCEHIFTESNSKANQHVMPISQVETLVSAMAAIHSPSSGQTCLSDESRMALNQTIAVNWR